MALACGLLAAIVLRALPVRAEPGTPVPPGTTECERRVLAGESSELSCLCLLSGALRGKVEAEAALVRVEAVSRQKVESGCLLLARGLLQRQLLLPAARQQLAAAAAFFSEAGQGQGEAYARLNLAPLLLAAGEEEAAARQLELAEAAALRARSPVLGAIRVEQARLLLQRGEALEQIEPMLRQVQNEARADDHSLQRGILQVLGQILHQLGRHDEAEAAFRRLAELTAGRDLFAHAMALHSLAISRLTRQPEPATRKGLIELLRQTIGAAQAGGNLWVEAEAHRWLGRLIGGEEGRAEIEISRKLAREVNDPVSLRLSLSALASHVVENDPATARKLLDEARRIAISEETPYAAIYGWYDRFKVIWATRPQAEALAEAHAELRRIEELRELQRDSLKRAEIFSVWADAYSWLAGRLLESGELAAAFELLERRHARVWLEASGGTFASLAATQAALAPGEAFLYFQQAYLRDHFGEFAGGSWLLVLTREGARVYATTDPVALAAAVPGFDELLRRGDGIAKGAAAALEKDLLSEALAELPVGISRLLVVADQDLHRLPWAALRTQNDSPALAERFELVLVPSASFWLRRRQERDRPDAKPAPARALVMVDPELGEAGQALSLKRLPHAGEEGRGVLSHLASGELWSGREASETGLGAALPGNFGIVHLAAHAIVGDRGRGRTAVVLASEAGSDGLLEPTEIRRLPLQGKLVVLSACSSASGEVLPGEGPLSLASAFFEAGATTVIASLWPLRDDQAARFFNRFYPHLARGEKVSTAFTAAVRESLAAGEPAEAWAGLVLIGDGDFRVEPVAKRSTPILLGISGLLAALLFWRFRRKS